MSAHKTDTVESFFNKYDAKHIAGMPKYARLREAIARAVEDGFWKAGEKIPNESLFSASKRYSLGTVQRALNELEAMGKIERFHGHGSFVKEPVAAMDQPNHLRFVDVDECNMEVFPKILGRYSVATHNRCTALLHADPRHLLRIDRIFRVGPAITTYSRFYIDISKYPIFSTRDIVSLQSDNFKTLLRKEYNIHIATYKQYLRVQPFGDVARFFDTESDVVGAILEFTGISEHNTPIYFQEVYIPPNHAKLDLSHSIIAK